MSVDYCAQLLHELDPDRFGICLMVAPERRARLLTLYALNLELARAPLASNEPLVAEMRLQWWIDSLESLAERQPQPHELLSPLAEAWGARAAAFAELAEARRRDAAREPHDGPQAVCDYVRATAVPLTQFAAEALSVAAEAAPVVAAQAEGVGLVQWLAALPALQRLGLGLWDPAPSELARLADLARARLAEAAAGRRMISRALAPVLYPGPAAGAILAAAPRGIEALADAAPSEFRRRLALGRFALTHRWRV